MKRLMQILMMVFLGFLMVAGVSCGDGGSNSMKTGPDAGKVLYNRYNIHYYTARDENFASYANYVDSPGHGFVPYNTALKIGSYRRGFMITIVDTDMVIYFEYNQKNMEGMDIAGYIDLIMSPTPVAYNNLSAKDQQGIKTGQALVGMTKEGVKIALGYPAKHKTPSLEDNTWTYWRNRFRTEVVTFDSNGQVTSIQ